MKIIKSNFWVFLFLFGIYINSHAQQEFDKDERDLIADNIDILMSDMSSTLKFQISIPPEVLTKIREQLPKESDSVSQQYLDSLYYLKIDSVKNIQRENLLSGLYDKFYDADKEPGNPVVNFAFDKLLVKDSVLTLQHFAEKYVNLYSQVEGDFQFFYKSGDDHVPNLRPIIQMASFEKHNRGYKVLINLRMGWLKGTYDTTSKIYRTISAEKKKQIGQFYNTRAQGDNIDLSAYVYFRKPGDTSEYKLISLQSPESSIIFPELQEYLTKGIIENLRLYGRLSLTGETPDSTLAPEFLNLFESRDKKSIQCNLFFPDEVCKNSFGKSKDAIIISPVQYCDHVLQNYSAIATFDVEPVANALQVKKENSFYVVKWPAKVLFIPYDFDDEVPDGIGYETMVNLYFKVDYRAGGLLGKNGESKYKNAKITDIAAYDKVINIPQPTKKGGFSLSVQYKPMVYQFQVDQNTAFKDFENQYPLSNSIGLNVGYYWFGKRPGRYMGIETGFYYEMIQSSMTLDSSYYFVDRTNSVTTNESDANTVNYYEERVWAKDFVQNIKFNLMTIPLMFHYMSEMDTKVLFDLGIGANISLVNENSIEISQDDGTSTHKGWYEITYCDGTTGEYLLEDIPEYGYENNVRASLADPSSGYNSTLVYLCINPTFSIPANGIFNHAYIDIGANFRYGLNTLFKNENHNKYIMESTGVSNDVFSNGVKNNDIAFGLSIGLRFFNNDDKRKDKIFKF